MKQFDSSFIDYATYINSMRKPDFNNLLKVLHREKPDRPTLFEFFLNDDLNLKLTGVQNYDPNDKYSRYKVLIQAYTNAGYDYVTILGSDFHFPSKRHQEEGQKTVSLNEGGVIFDRESFNSYQWPDPDDYDYSILSDLEEYLPDGMKFIVYSYDGVLENVIRLTGFENLCYIIKEDPVLADDIFSSVGSRLAHYYSLCLRYSSVGAAISNDDWGFVSATMLSPQDIRRFVIPWHKKIADTIHSAGRPAILHSCGNLENVMDDIIDYIGYEAKHSYEDKIIPVEKAYEKYGKRIAILGGIDVDFICRHTPQEVYERSAAMIEKTSELGGYALGSGNSIPSYVPDETYMAMIAAVR